MDVLRSVWVEETCISCNCCETAAPEVFHLDDGIAMILGSAREDGITSSNAERSPLNVAGLAEREAIREAAAGCPVEAIRLVEA